MKLSTALLLLALGASDAAPAGTRRRAQDGDDVAAVEIRPHGWGGSGSGQGKGGRKSCGNLGETPCIDTEGPASSICNEGLSPQLHPEWTLCLPCGSGIGELPCPDTECASGLTPDGFGWFNFASSPLALTILFEGFGDDDRRLSETPATFAAIKNKRRLHDGEPDEDKYPLGLCAPCGEFGQIPCAPCEGGCATCSEGLIATNLLGYFNGNSNGDITDGFGTNTTVPTDLFLIVGINICLPCGAEDQPPCEDTKCNHGLAPDINGGNTCEKCGLKDQPPCEDGCNAGLIQDPDSANCVKCGKIGQLPCEDGCVPGAAIGPSNRCDECGADGQVCCCDSSEFDDTYLKLIGGELNGPSDDLKFKLMVSLIDSAAGDPDKCIRGCDRGLRCGANGACYTP